MPSTGPGRAVLDGEHTRAIFNITSGRTVSLVALTLTRGAAPRGAVAYARPGARLSMSNCTISDSIASSSTGDAYGGVLYLSRDASAELTGCTISDSAAESPWYSAHGGVVYLETNADATLTDCTIRGVAARGADRARGGVLYLDTNSSATLAGCSITNVSAMAPRLGGQGGVSSVGRYSRLALVSCAVSEAWVSGLQYAGGGVMYLHADGDATVTASNVSRARAFNTDTHPHDRYVHGAVACVNQGSSATFTGCVITDSGSSTIDGEVNGLFETYGRSSLRVSNSLITNITSFTDRGASAGALVWAGTTANASFVNCVISNFYIESNSTTLRLRIRGGLVAFSSWSNPSIITFTGCTVTNVTNYGRHITVRGGFAAVLQGSLLKIEASNISDVISIQEDVGEDRGAMDWGGGGVLYLQDSSSAELVATRVERCAIHALNGSIAEGGFAYAWTTSGIARITLSHGTVLIGNKATTGGQTLMLYAATAVYVMPTLLGHWVHGSTCLVNRMPCAQSEAACQRVEEACRRLPIAQGASVDGTPCPELYPIQSCDWEALPQLVGQTIDTLPQGALDVDYPYACAPGVLGSDQPEYQVSPRCAGPTPAGTYQPFEAGTAAIRCPAGSYCPRGSMQRVSCEIGAGIPFSTTIDSNATSSEACVCQRGSYNNATSAGGLSCAACPAGTNCSRPGLLLTTLPLKVGYYRLNESSLDVRRCPDASEGCGGNGAGECYESRSVCHGGEDVATQCMPGFTGAFCLLCEQPRHIRRTVLHGSNHSQPENSIVVQSGDGKQFACVDCAVDGLLGHTAAVLAAAVAGLVLMLFALEVVRRRLPAYVQWWIVRLWRASNPPNKLKIVMGYYMIITKIDTVYQAAMPASVRAMLEPFRLSVTLGMGSTNDVLACLNVPTFLGRLVVWMVLPVLLVLLLVLGCVCWLTSRKELTRDALLRTSLPLITRLLFVLYPLVTNVAFEAFSCYEFDGADALTSNRTAQSFLVSDVAVACESDEYRTITGVAWLAIFVCMLYMDSKSSLYLPCL